MEREATIQKIYLGDAVYAAWDKLGRVVLTTEDGIRATNTIVFEPEVLAYFQRWLSYTSQAAQSPEVEERGDDD